MIKTLITLANKLDIMGLFDDANKIDLLVQKYAADEEEPIIDKKPSQHIAVSVFAEGRHTKEGRYSYFDGTSDELIKLVEANFSKAKPSYRDGVVVVSVPADRFYSSTIQLTEGMEFTGKYEPRRPKERPYIQMTPVGFNKLPAKHVDIILYRHDVLLEDENERDKVKDSEWEIVSINASPWEVKEGEEAEPMHPETLMRNYFVEEGGTEMKGVTPEKFVEMLRKSREYWRDKTMVG